MQEIKGYQIGFVKTPIQKSLPNASVLSQDRKSIVDREVFELQEKHVIHLVNKPLMEESFVSSLFVVPKKGEARNNFIFCGKGACWSLLASPLA